MDSNLIIDELIGGSERLAYKARKEKKPKKDKKGGDDGFGSKFKKAFKKALGIKQDEKKSGQEEDDKPTREESERQEMDDYFTNFNWELADQKPMELPPRGKKMQAVDLAEVAEVEDSEHDDDAKEGTNKSKAPIVESNVGGSSPGLSVSKSAEPSEKPRSVLPKTETTKTHVPNAEQSYVPKVDSSVKVDSGEQSVTQKEEANDSKHVERKLTAMGETARSSEVNQLPADPIPVEIPVIMAENIGNEELDLLNEMNAPVASHTQDKADTKSFDLKLNLAEEPFNISFTDIKTTEQNDREPAQL